MAGILSRCLKVSILLCAHGFSERAVDLIDEKVSTQNPSKSSGAGLFTPVKLNKVRFTG